MDILGKGERYLNSEKRDSVVSVEKRRLIRKLTEYYSAEGQDDAIEVSLPKRGFTLEFQLRRSQSSPAWHFYQKARHLWPTRRPKAIQEAIEPLNHALQMDVTLAPAHAALADCYSHLALWGARPLDVLPRAREHALHALEIDEESWEAHAALAAVHMCNWEWAQASDDTCWPRSKRRSAGSDRDRNRRTRALQYVVS